jgi:hypothetical protein
MILSDPNIAACLMAGLGLSCYYMANSPYQSPIEGVLSFFEPSTITRADFDRYIEGPNPCANFRNIKLVYTLPAEEVAPAMRELSLLGCFDNKKSISKAAETALEAKHEDSLIILFDRAVIRSHYEPIGPWFFYSCAFSKLYQCVIFILNNFPLANYEGKNIVHLAAIFDDPTLLDIAPQDNLYLDLRDRKGNVPTKYVKSPEMFSHILRRNEFESSRLPNPNEHEANIEYLRKSFEIGFSVPIASRINLLFTDNNLMSSFFKLNLEVARNKIFKHSYKQLHGTIGTWYTSNFYGRIFIKFKGEAVDDYGGSRNDWLSSLLETFFKANPDGNAADFTAPLFYPVEENQNIYQPTGLYDTSVYKFAGSIVALALSKGIPTRVEFIPALYRVMLGIEPYRFEDLEIQSPSEYNRLKSLRKSFLNKDPIPDLELNSLQEVDYHIRICAAKLLCGNHLESLDAFAQGFRSKLPHKLSKYLDLVDLKAVLRGQETVSTEEFREKVSLRYNISYSPRISQTFFQVFDQLSQDERFKLIRFITGRNGLPYGGFTNLHSEISVFFDRVPVGQLPTSKPRFSSLYLPEFTTLEELKALLLNAIA